MTGIPCVEMLPINHLLSLGPTWTVCFLCCLPLFDIDSVLLYVTGKQGRNGGRGGSLETSEPCLQYQEYPLVNMTKRRWKSTAFH